MKSYKYILTIGSVIGLIASFFLMIDTISLIKNPNTDLPCNISPFISCGNSILSEQGEIFGFPNPIIGIISFSALLSLGIVLLTKNTLNKKMMQIVNIGILGSMIFVLWFYYQSLFNLGTLCIYCMTVWVVTWPIFLFTIIENYLKGNIGNFDIWKKIYDNQYQILIIGYLLAILGIILKFRDYFLS